jgi:hypothetical protein
MPQNTPVNGSGIKDSERAAGGCHTGRTPQRPQLTVLIIIMLGLVVPEYLLLVNDAAVTTLSAPLAIVLLAVDIADRLSAWLVPRRA